MAKMLNFMLRVFYHSKRRRRLNKKGKADRQQPGRELRRGDPGDLEPRCPPAADSLSRYPPPDPRGPGLGEGPAPGQVGHSRATDHLSPRTAHVRPPLRRSHDGCDPATPPGSLLPPTGRCLSAQTLRTPAHAACWDRRAGPGLRSAPCRPRAPSQGTSRTRPVGGLGPI